MCLCPAVLVLVAISDAALSAAFSQWGRCCCCCHMKRMHVSFTVGSETVLQRWESEPNRHLTDAITGKHSAPSPHMHMTLTLPLLGWGSRDAEQLICYFNALEWVSGRCFYTGNLGNGEIQIWLQWVSLQLTSPDTHRNIKYKLLFTRLVRQVSLQISFDFIRDCHCRGCSSEPLPVTG